MRKQIEPGPDELRKLGYEARDISLPTLIKWVSGLFFFVAFSSIVGLLLYVVFVPRDGRADLEASTSAQTTQHLSPEPRVQPYPIPDMVNFRAKEEKALGSYAWKDQAKGTVQIPVEQAIQREAQRLLVTPNGE